jgi:UDP-N-acetylmuramoylalanine--D-glutamate ligase
MITVTSFANKSIGVFGLGRSGLSAVRALEAGGSDVWAWDDIKEKRESAEMEGIKLTNLYQSDLSKIDILVLSPGIPDQYPEPHSLTIRAREADCEIICDIDLLARENTKARFIGISGTNGKSTTTSLIGHIFNQASYQAEIGGNFGIPALDLLPLDERGTYVLEISSYQLERIPTVKLDIAILLNISADHLERHGGMGGYIAAKKILFERINGDGVTIIGMEDTHCRGICMELMIGRGAKNIVPVSALARMPGGVYVDSGMLIDDIRNTQETIMDLRSLSTLPGRHNWQNAAAAYAAAITVGIEPDIIIEALKTFGGLAHRQEVVRNIGEISFINDSKATNSDAAAKALDCYDNIHWILGGEFKEENLGSLHDVLKKVAHAYLIGRDSERLEILLSPFIPVTRCGDLETAIHEAYRKANSTNSNTVLLSPACASFDQFKNFEERGDIFRSFVNSLRSVLL